MYDDITYPFPNFNDATLFIKEAKYITQRTCHFLHAQWRKRLITWWRHNMDRLSALLALCNRWIPLPKGQRCGALIFHLLVSSRSHLTNIEFSFKTTWPRCDVTIIIVTYPYSSSSSMSPSLLTGSSWMPLSDFSGKPAAGQTKYILSRTILSSPLTSPLHTVDALWSCSRVRSLSMRHRKVMMTSQWFFRWRHNFSIISPNKSTDKSIDMDRLTFPKQFNCR